MKPTQHIIKRISYSVLASALVLGMSPATLAVASEAASATTSSVAEQSYETVDASFTFADDAITCDAGDSGAYAAETSEAGAQILTIKQAGTYKVSGSCALGQIVVAKGLTGVTIVLDGLTLSNDGDKVVKLKENAEATIVVKGENTLSSANDKAIIKSNGDGTGAGSVTLDGDGTLNFKSSYSEVVDGETEGCDAVNGEGDVTVLGGTYNIDVTDDGFHADYVLTVGAKGSSGPNIQITNATEGLEGATVNLYSGNGTIKTSDDGINAANSDLSASSYEYAINIAGGTWNVVSGGDAVDSNGNLTVSGGTTTVYCTGSGNGALDIGAGEEGEIKGTFSYTGGTLLAVGSDMLVTPSKGTYVLFGGQGMGQRSGGSSIVAKGSTVNVTDGSNELFSSTAAASGNYALFMSDSLASGTAYTLASGNASTQATATSGASKAQQGQGQQGQAPSSGQGQAPDSSQGSSAGGQQGQAPDFSQGQPPQMPGFSQNQDSGANQGQTPDFAQGQPPQMPGSEQNQQDNSSGMPNFMDMFMNFFNGGQAQQDGTEAEGEQGAPQGDMEQAQQAGQQVVAGSGASKATYTIVKEATERAGSVTYTKSMVSAKTTKATVPASVQIGGKTYKVTGIAEGAFADTKVKTVTIKTTKLSKKRVADSLSGSSVKTVKVKVSKKSSVNKKYVKKYKSYFKTSNSGKKASVK